MKFKFQDVMHASNSPAPPDLCDALTKPAANAKTVPAEPAAPTVPVIDCGTFSPAPNPNEPKIVRFIKLCHLTDGLTVKEIAGGTQLPTADVRTALDSLVASGTLTAAQEPETEFQRRRYNTPNAAEVVAPAPEVYETADQRINRAAEAERERIRREHPAPMPPPNYRPSDEEVASALLAQEAKRKSIVFTAEEREQLKLMEGRLSGLNPNIALKR